MSELSMSAMGDVGAVFHRPDKSLIKVGSAPLQEMLRHRQVSQTEPEAGGVLLGRLIECTWDVVVDEVTAPGHRDRRWRHGFFRSRGRAQRRIREAWIESQQTRNYLGEWHTHPQDHPVPSKVDLADWARIVAKSRFEQDSLIFLIVGRKSVEAWELHKGGILPFRLIPGWD